MERDVRRGGRGPAVLTALAVALALAGSAAAAPTPEEAFAVGYATAVIERELGLSETRVSLEDGELLVEAPHLPVEARAKLERLARELPGVSSLRLAERRAGAGSDALPPPVAAGGDTWEVLPEDELFDPLLADPRWPHFSAALQAYLGDAELETVTAVSFGETIPLLARRAGDGRFQLALHAGVFSVFDLDAESFDLINSDFLVGLAASYRRGDLSLLGRFFHQSSHLGDEYLLRDRVERINLSFEAVDALVSWDLGEAFRLYGGFAALLRTDPSDLEPWSLQAGAEYRSPTTWWEGRLRPVAGVDLHWRQENDWRTDVSARAGLQLENARVLGSRVQLLLEVYDGSSPNGQFFARDVRFLGLGAHLHY